MEQRNVSCRPKERQLYTRKNTEMKKKINSGPRKGILLTLFAMFDCLHQQSVQAREGLWRLIFATIACISKVANQGGARRGSNLRPP